MESRVVTAVGLSINTALGVEANRRIEQAMSIAVLECNAEGISTEEKNAHVIRERMHAARVRMTAEIEQELVRSSVEVLAKVFANMEGH